MPVININGGQKSISWAQTILYADTMGLTAPMFANRYGPPPTGQGQMFWTTGAPPAPTAQEILQTDPDYDFTIHTENVAQEFHAQLGDIVSMFNAKPRATKTVDTTNTGKLLQEVYKYKAMTLRKADSIAYEKANTLKNKPFDWTTTQGMVGIEIEVENIRNGVSGLCAYWDAKADGSLRNNGIELVSIPLQIKQVQLALEHVYECMHKNNDPDFSNRTSIHVHVNCRDLTQDQIFNFVLLYALFEKHFYQVAGAKRMNSIFCVPLFRTNQMTTINEVIYGMSPNWHKYCGINLLPLFQNSVTQGYGTIEFRHLYGTKDQMEILHWINDILCLRKFACEISKGDLLEAIKTMNTTSSYMAMYSQVFAKGRRLLSNKKDFEECVSNIKRELFGNEYIETLRKTDTGPYWSVSRELGVRG